MARSRMMTLVLVPLLTAPFVVAQAWAQPLFTRDLCAAGTHWISVPTDTDLATAEDLCRAVPGALSVEQDSPQGVGQWTFDCVTGVCTSTSPIPEPGCRTSACFCVDDGEGIVAQTSGGGMFPINGCDQFVSLTLPVGGSTPRYMVSVPYNTFLKSFFDLGQHFGLPASVTSSGIVSGLDDCTQTPASCSMFTTTCKALMLVPGRAYQLVYPLPVPTAGRFLNPVACTLPAPPVAACPIDGLDFVSNTGLAWPAPVGCPLPLLYDAIRGDLACLRRTCAQPVLPLGGPPCAGCATLESAGIDAGAADPAEPALGAGFWYLARVDGGTWNDVDAGVLQCIDRDAAFSLGCP